MKTVKLLIVLLAACTSLGGCSDGSALPPNVRGVTHIDHGTDYVYLKESSAIGGACSGWNKVRIARRGDLYAGMDGMMCWKEEGAILLINTQRGDMQKSMSMDIMLDINGSPTMGPAGWLVIFLIVCVLISLIARAKGRSAIGLFFSVTVPALPFMAFISWGLGNNVEAKGVAIWMAAFLCPSVGLIWVLSAKNKDEMAAQKDSFGDRKKCQFCAEPIRTAAIKCRHCGSDLTPSTPADME